MKLKWSTYTASDGKTTACVPAVLKTKKRFLFCPKCNQKRLVTVKYFEWYGPIATCVGKRLKWAHFEECGYQWRWE